MEITSLMLIILGIVNLFLGFFIFLKNRTNVINILYGLLAFNVAIWSFSIYFFREIADITLFWSKIAYLSAGASAFLFLYFTLYFPFKIKLNFLWHLFFIIYSLILIWLIVGTKTVLKSYTLINDIHGIVFGGAYIFYSLYIFILFGFGFFNLISKYFKSRGLTKLQIKYVLAGGLLTVSIATITNLILFGKGIFKYNWVGPSSTIFLITLLAYAITKYHLFEIKVILTEILVGVMGGLLLVFSFLLPIQYRIWALAIFFLFLIFAYYLIKATHEESRRREEAERLAIQERAIRLKTEKLVRETEKLSRAKDQFLLSIQHHLRTPLTSVRGYLDLILKGYYQKEEIKKNCRQRKKRLTSYTI